MVVSNPKEIILRWRDFYQMKKVENKVFVFAVVLCVFRVCLLVVVGLFKQNTDTQAEKFPSKTKQVSTAGSSETRTFILKLINC